MSLPLAIRYPIGIADFDRIRIAVEVAGYGEDLDWSESLKPPLYAKVFAEEAIFVICNSGMRFTVARQIYNRVMGAVTAGRSASSAFGHKGKAEAIDLIWRRQTALFAEFLAAADKVAWCESLPWIGGITKYHLAKNLGVDCAKPDVHLQRLAAREGCTAQVLCERLAGLSGLRAATVDVVLWRACAIGVIDPRTLVAGRTRAQ